MSTQPEIETIEYLDDRGRSPFGAWMASLPGPAFTKVQAALARVRLGNPGDVKPVGEGVSERRIDIGPGYRIYFGRDGEKLVILLGGGTKRRQNKDIRDAKAAWSNYKQKKKEGA